MNSFNPPTLAADLAELRQFFSDFFTACSDQNWQRRTERADQGWTLRETVAHLDAVAQVYQQTIECALTGQPFESSEMTRRTDLPAWNQHQIEARAHLPIQTVCNSLLSTLRVAEKTAVRLSPADFARTALLPAYNRPITVVDLLGAHAAHPGLVHLAQLAQGAAVDPLWLQFSPDFLQRQLSRLFKLLSYTYWPERGGELRASVNFVALGAGGDSWHVILTPDGGSGGQGKVKPATLTVWFRDVDTLCRFFTLQVSLVRLLLTGRTFAWGNWPLGFRLVYLFNPI